MVVHAIVPLTPADAHARRADLVELLIDSVAAAHR